MFLNLLFVAKKKPPFFGRMTWNHQKRAKRLPLLLAQVKEKLRHSTLRDATEPMKGGLGAEKCCWREIFRGIVAAEVVSAQKTGGEKNNPLWKGCSE